MRRSNRKGNYLSPNVYETDGDVSRLRITRRDGEKFTITFDSFDLRQVQSQQWHARTRGAQRDDFGAYQHVGGGSPSQPLAEFLIGKVEGKHIHFLNGDGLDCRRANLVHLPHAAIMLRRRDRRHPDSGFTGVTWSAMRGRWQARYVNAGERHHVGYFDEPAAAAAAIEARRMSEGFTPPVRE